MNIILFLVALIASFIVVRIGAIAFQLTGLEWSLAKFQALSCFTGTGFTTKESELITNNPQRRRIASFLIILGHAGFIALIATFANSLRPQMLMPDFKIPFLDLFFPSRILPWVNLIFLTGSIYLIYRIFTHSKFTQKITDFLKQRIMNYEIVKPVSFEELLVATGGFGLSRIDILKDNKLKEKTLKESGLSKENINVLALERGKEMIVNPSSDTKISEGDKLICFGKLDKIKSKIS